MEFYLVCEGDNDSLDIKVLNLIIAQKLGKMVRVEPGNGTESLKSIRSWLEKSRGAKVLLVRDRDYLSGNQVRQSRAPDKKEFIWSRHEIENFLIEPRVVALAFGNLKNDVQALKNIPVHVDDVVNLMADLAKPLLEPHVGLAFCESVRNKISRWDIDCPQKYVTKSDWLFHTTGKITETARNYQQQFASPDFEYSALEQEYDLVSKRILNPEYISSGEFVRDLGGKELKSALMTYLHKQGVPISKDDFNTELVKALDVLYAPGFFGPDDDFVDLAKRIP